MMELWRYFLLVSAVCGLLLYRADSRRISRHCNKVLRTASEFDETPSTLATLTSRCQSGKITWRLPHNGQIVTFYMSRRTFTVCLNGDFPGASIYRLTGPSRMLLTDANSTGPLGCFKSHCGHVSLLFEVGTELSPSLLKYTYSGASDSRCPACTETCQKGCMCSAEYVFSGKLESSSYNSGLYTHYFRVAEFLKYDKQYTLPALSTAADVEYCQSPEVSSQPLSSGRSFIPKDGLVRVRSKCILKINKTYFIASHFHDGRGLVLCCAHEDERFVKSFLEDMLHRRECCA